MEQRFDFVELKVTLLEDGSQVLHNLMTVEHVRKTFFTRKEKIIAKHEFLVEIHRTKLKKKGNDPDLRTNEIEVISIYEKDTGKRVSVNTSIAPYNSFSYKRIINMDGPTCYLGVYICDKYTQHQQKQRIENMLEKHLDSIINEQELALEKKFQQLEKTKFIRDSSKQPMKKLKSENG